MSARAALSFHCKSRCSRPVEEMLVGRILYLDDDEALASLVRKPWMISSVASWAVGN